MVNRKSDGMKSNEIQPVGGRQLFLGFATNALAASSERLLSLTFADATVTVARQVAAGAFAPEKPLALGTRQFEGLPMYQQAPAFCRVALRLKPSADSDINVEIWMPTTGWNGRLAGSGNGRSAGFIRYPELGALLVQGYAVAGTDTGHEGAATDWSFALGHPENLIDLGYRSVHEMAVKAKVIVNAFYGRPARRSVLERLLYRWPSRLDRGATLSRRLRRNRRRCSGQLHDAIERPIPLGVASRSRGIKTASSRRQSFSCCTAQC